MSMYKTLEHHEHAEHIAHEAHAAHAEAAHAETERRLGASRLAALLVAVCAAGLALSEQGARHAEIRVQENSIAAADAWAQYQAKSTRATVARDIATLLTALDANTPEATVRRTQALEALNRDQERYEQDPQDGKQAVAARAQALERARDYALEQTHAYHNGSAALELGIVLATASAILGSRMLMAIALAIGSAGGVVAFLGLFAPEFGAF